METVVALALPVTCVLLGLVYLLQGYHLWFRGVDSLGQAKVTHQEQAHVRASLLVRDSIYPHLGAVHVFMALALLVSVTFDSSRDAAKVLLVNGVYISLALAWHLHLVRRAGGNPSYLEKGSGTLKNDMIMMTLISGVSLSISALVLFS